MLLKIPKLPRSSEVASRWAGWALAHPKFGVIVNPIQTGGNCTTANPFRFEKPNGISARRKKKVEWGYEPMLSKPT